jgi:hypothetical protein
MSDCLHCYIREMLKSHLAFSEITGIAGVSDIRISPWALSALNGRGWLGQHLPHSFAAPFLQGLPRTAAIHGLFMRRCHQDQVGEHFCHLGGDFRQISMPACPLCLICEPDFSGHVLLTRHTLPENSSTAARNCKRYTIYDAWQKRISENSLAG